MYRRTEEFTERGAVSKYLIEGGIQETVVYNSTINFIIYEDQSIYEETLTRLIKTVKLGKSKAVFQLYDEEVIYEDDQLFRYKRVSLSEILDIVSEENYTDDVDGYPYPKVFILSQFLDYDYKDRNRFISELYGQFFRRLILSKNVMFVIPIKVNKIPYHIDMNTEYSEDEYSDFKVVMDLVEESVYTFIKFYFLRGYKQIIDTFTF